MELFALLALFAWVPLVLVFSRTRPTSTPTANRPLMQILELLQESEVLIDDCGSDFSAT